MTPLRRPPLTPSDERLRGRGARWAVRHGGGRVPRFDDLALRSAWDRLDEGARERALRVAALLHVRPQIDRKLNGQALGALSRTVGEALFDAVLEEEVPALVASDEASIPMADALTDVGRTLLARGAAGEGDAADLIERAARLVEAHA